MSDRERLYHVVCWTWCAHPKAATRLTEMAAETAAQSLAATLGFLAVHDEIQEEVYQEIKTVLSDHLDPVRTVVSEWR